MSSMHKPAMQNCFAVDHRQCSQQSLRTIAASFRPAAFYWATVGFPTRVFVSPCPKLAAPVNNGCALEERSEKLSRPRRKGQPE